MVFTFPKNFTRWLPWAGSILLVAGLLSTQDLGAVGEALDTAAYGQFCASLLIWASLNWLMDVLFLHCSVYWLTGVNRPWEMLRLRAASYLLTAVSTAVGYGGVVAYLKRRFDVPVGRGTALMLNEALHEVGTIGALAALSVWLLGSDLEQEYAIFCFGAACVGFYAFCVVLSRVGPKLGFPKTPLSLFEEIGGRQYTAFFAIKLVQNIVQGVWVTFALSCFGVDVPVVASIAFTQVIHLTRSLPVAAFGIGVDQLTFPTLYAAWEPEGGGVLLAFSMVFTCSMLVGRAVLGVPFAQTVLAALRQPRPTTGKRDHSPPRPRRTA
jgi:hypothetical protein